MPVKNQQGHPPKNGWTGYTYPKEGYEKTFDFKYKTLDDLITHIREYEKQNELEPIPNIVDKVQQYFCNTCEFYRQFCRNVEEPKDRSLIESISTIARGAAAVARINFKSRLNILDEEEISNNVKHCASCSFNYFKPNRPIADEEVDGFHETMYKGKLAESYEVDNLAEVATEEHKAGKIGTVCRGCGCNQFSKVYLDPEDYAGPLMSNIHDINRLLKARIDYDDGSGIKGCWQLKAILNEKNLRKGLKQGYLTRQDLKDNE